jgi:hypothetical protein
MFCYHFSRNRCNIGIITADIAQPVLENERHLPFYKVAHIEVFFYGG